jgi:hypothetical protein
MTIAVSVPIAEFTARYKGTERGGKEVLKDILSRGKLKCLNQDLQD